MMYSISIGWCNLINKKQTFRGIEDIKGKKNLWRIQQAALLRYVQQEYGHVWCLHYYKIKYARETIPGSPFLSGIMNTYPLKRHTYKFWKILQNSILINEEVTCMHIKFQVQLNLFISIKLTIRWKAKLKSTVRWFVMREKHCTMADKFNRTG